MHASESSVQITTEHTAHTGKNSGVNLISAEGL